jgi:hypothetical protein
MQRVHTPRFTGSGVGVRTTTGGVPTRADLTIAGRAYRFHAPKGYSNPLYAVQRVIMQW